MTDTEWEKLYKEAPNLLWLFYAQLVHGGSFPFGGLLRWHGPGAERFRKTMQA